MSDATLYWVPTHHALGVHQGGGYINIWVGATLTEAIEAFTSGAPPSDAMNIRDYATGLIRPTTVDDVRRFLENSEGLR